MLFAFVLFINNSFRNICEKDRAGDTAYTEDITHQCKNLKERREEEYILLNKMVCKTSKVHTWTSYKQKARVKMGIPPWHGQWQMPLGV